MEIIQIKTIDPISQDLLRSATNQKIPLLWERYEKLQPQDGFLRTGLSCPFGCLQGPCRIDPFGRGADRGICGLDKEGMVSAMLLRLMLQGTLELAGKGAYQTPEKDEESWPSSLLGTASRALGNLGGGKLGFADISRAAFLLQRPMESPEELIRQSLRLGLLSLQGLSRGSEFLPSAGLAMKTGYGILTGKGVILGVCGQPSSEWLTLLSKEISQKSSGSGQLVSLGSWVRSPEGFLPCACTSGEAELLLSSGKIHLMIAGPGTDPAVAQLCLRLEIPLILPQDHQNMTELYSLANKKASASSKTALDPLPPQVEEAEVILNSADLEKWIRKSSPRGLAILGGTDTPQHSFGWIPTEVASNLRGGKAMVAAWGDAALWIMKKGLCSPQYDPPVRLLENEQGPYLAARAWAACGQPLSWMKVSFSGLKGCKDLALALGLAALGLNVNVTTPLPLWGSEKVRSLLAGQLAGQGGKFSHYDHPAQAQEVLDWFVKEEA